MSKEWDIYNNLKLELHLGGWGIGFNIDTFDFSVTVLCFTLFWERR